MRDFRDKVIWITGASSGLGREMAVQSAAMGAKLVLSARSSEALEALKSELQSTECLVLPMDVSGSDDFSAEAERVLEKFGRIDLVFMAAGVSQRSEAFETSMETTRKIMDINFFGNIALAKAVLPQMRKQQQGSFCVISSITGKTGFYLRSIYAASKHALHGYFESLRFEEYDNNIKVHMICPGPVNTNMSRNSLDASGKPRGVHDAMQENGMTPEDCISQIIDSIKKEKFEAIISRGPEAFGMKLKALLPRLYFKMARRRNAHG